MSRILIIIELLQRAPDSVALTAKMAIVHVVVILLATAAFVAPRSAELRHQILDGRVPTEIVFTIG